ncbi:copper chaperone PCu(A)C [Promicromonospora iranensis]|jgi:copper(I)-binding protein|uniref:copper chaperone PCu(A)C n=1 Tax=Promicromonospora iranensis TaxID=1105144 RepID=UPI0023A9E6D2|nr:copper chaperone PCu(A)C [Promicromonospora iranensis]
MTIRALVAALGLTALLVVLSACGSPSEAASPTEGQAQPMQADTVQAKDLWVKAVDSGMSAGFGTLTNTGSSDVVLTSAASIISSDMELHVTGPDEDGQMVMSPQEGGFIIAPGDTLVLEPGGDHIMFMDVREPVGPGDTVDLTLTFEDGSAVDVTAPAKDFTGGDEEYVPGTHE